MRNKQKKVALKPKIKIFKRNKPQKYKALQMWKDKKKRMECNNNCKSKVKIQVTHSNSNPSVKKKKKKLI